jgi:hypothetical protein
MLIKEFFIKNLNFDIYCKISHILKNVKINIEKDLIKNLIKFYDKKWLYYKNKKNGDRSLNQTLCFEWNYFLYKEIKKCPSFILYKKLLETINNEQIHNINNRDLEYIIYKINDNYLHN